MKVFVSHSLAERELAGELTHALREEGHDVLGPAQEIAATDLVSEISSAIRAADVVVAIVTAANPMSFYELGAAWGAGIPMLVAARAGDPLPPELVSIPYVRLSGESSRDTHEIVRRTLELAGPPRTPAEDFESAQAALSAASHDPSALALLSAVEFENLVLRLFQERGFTVISGPAVRDWGGDFVIDSDTPILVEVKKRSSQSRESVQTVRILSGLVAAAGAAGGIVVSSSGFTAAAQAFAQTTRIALLTLEELLTEGSTASLPGLGNS